MQIKKFSWGAVFVIMNVGVDNTLLPGNHGDIIYIPFTVNTK